MTEKMKLTPTMRQALAAIGKIGGSSRSPAKQRASRANGKLGGKLGGRPRIYPKCPRYGAHRFSPKSGRCPCGYKKPD